MEAEARSAMPLGVGSRGEDGGGRGAVPGEGSVLAAAPGAGGKVAGMC